MVVLCEMQDVEITSKSKIRITSRSKTEISSTMRFKSRRENWQSAQGFSRRVNPRCRQLNSRAHHPRGKLYPWGILCEIDCIRLINPRSGSYEPGRIENWLLEIGEDGEAAGIAASPEACGPQCRVACRECSLQEFLSPSDSQELVPPARCMHVSAKGRYLRAGQGVVAT